MADSGVSDAALHELAQQVGVVGRRVLRFAYDPSRDALKIDQLERLVRLVQPSLFETNPGLAICRVFDAALADLPDGPVEPYQITWRELGTALYPTSPSEASPYKTRYEALKIRLDVGNVKDPKTFRRRVDTLRLKLAAQLMELAASAELVTQQADTYLIERSEYVDRARAMLDAGDSIIWIWGEPGTGKTTLASQIAKAFAARRVLTLRTADANILGDDLVDALISEGLRPATWSESYCRAELRRILAHEPRSGAVILDNIGDQALVWQLIPDRPTIPVLITSRARPRDSRIPHFELNDFTKAEARTFIENSLASRADNSPQFADTDVAALAMVFGYRPLALEHACRYIREAPGVSLRSLVATLAESTVTGLRLVTVPSDRLRNMVRLYEIILAAITQEDMAVEVLDCFLALTGKEGMQYSDLLSYFMESSYGGHRDRIHFISGLRVLADYGLLRRADPELFGIKAPILAMHPLAYEIIRELRGVALFRIEGAFIRFLVSPEIMAEELNIKVADGRFQAKLRSLELAAVMDLLPGWKLLHVVDASTWIAIRVPLSEGAGEPYTVRYEILPTAIFKVEDRVGKREEITPDEARAFLDVAHLYQMKLKREVFDKIRALEPDDDE